MTVLPSEEHENNVEERKEHPPAFQIQAQTGVLKGEVEVGTETNVAPDRVHHMSEFHINAEVGTLKGEKNNLPEETKVAPEIAHEMPQFKIEAQTLEGEDTVATEERPPHDTIKVPPKIRGQTSIKRVAAQ